MKKTALITLILLLVAALFVLPGCQGTEDTPDDQVVTETYSIGIIQYVEHVALDSARQGFIDALADNGYVDGENLDIDIQNAQADQSNLSTISDTFIGNNVDLVLAIATPAAQAIAGKTTEIPILGTAITDYVVAKLVDSNEMPGGNVTGTNDMNPIADQIDLLVKLVPDAQTVGVIYTSNEDNSILQASIAKDAIEALGLTYTEVTVSNSNEVQQAVQSLVGQCDAIYIPTDNIMASSMPIIHGVTVDSQTPVICGESGMAAAGGLATLGINYYNLGYQTGLMAIKVLTGEATPATMPIEASSDFDFYINGTVADELGMTIPDDLTQYVVYEETTE